MAAISIIVPVYKVEPYINRCLDSILCQTFDDFELILVDDGSPDNCPSICDEYASRDSRIHVIHKENGGLPNARNSGIEWVEKNSDSEWITFIDSDDYIRDTYLEVLLSLAEENGVKLSICGYSRSYSDIAETLDARNITYVLSPDELYGIIGELSYVVTKESAWGKLYHRSVFDGTRYPNLKIAEDSATTYKVMFRCDKIAVSTQNLYMYYQSPESLMRSKQSLDFLFVLDVDRDKIAYFRENGFKSAYKQAFTDYLSTFVFYINIAHREKNTKKYRELKKQLRNEIKLHRNELRLSIFRTPENYIPFFPLTSRIIIKLRLEINKLKKD